MGIKLAFALLQHRRRRWYLNLAAAEPDTGREVGGQVADVERDPLANGAQEAQLDTAIGQAPRANLPNKAPSTSTSLLISHSSTGASAGR